MNFVLAKAIREKESMTKLDAHTEIGSDKRKTYLGVVGCYNSILAQGILELIEDEPNFLLLGMYTNCESLLNTIDENDPDFCIVDTFFLKCLMYGARDKKKFSQCKILMIEDIHLTPQELHSLIVESHVSGILYKNTDKKLFKKALFKVLSGELWFKRETFESLFNKTKEIIESRIIFRKLLTPAETRVVDLVCQGLKNKEVAERLYVSESTIKSHLSSIYKKLNVRNRVQLMNLYLNEK